MNAGDYIDLIVSCRQAGAESAMNFVGLVFAYFVMAYFVGTRLTRLQIWLASIVYTVFLVFPVYGAIQNFITTNALALEFHSEFPLQASKFVSQTPTIWQLFVVMAVASWLISVGFMVTTSKGTGSGQSN
jgi:hypothetical protein